MGPHVQRFVPVIFKFMRALITLRSMKHSKSLMRPHNKNVFSFYTAALSFTWYGIKSKTTVVDVEQKNKFNDVDTLFENRHYEQCYQLLSSMKEDDVELHWRMCRVLYNMSKELKVNNAYKKELILKAFDIISEQLESNNNHFYVHKWYALLLDEKSGYDGIKERIRQLENVKTHMDLAVTLNPNDATTLHMLGEWCYQVTELPWYQRKIAEALFASPPYSSYEDALEYFLRAESAEPRFYSINLLRIGNCYMKLEKEDQAKYYLKLAASYPAKSNDDHRANKEATEILKQMNWIDK